VVTKSVHGPRGSCPEITHQSNPVGPAQKSVSQAGPNCSKATFREHNFQILKFAEKIHS